MTDENEKNVVLASGSEFRRQGLDLLEIDYEVMPSGIDESSIRSSDPEDLVLELAEAKARDVGEGLGEDSLVIAGDLLVLHRGRIHEKPETEREALETLQSFSGEEVEVVSGVALFDTDTGDLESAPGRTRISFRDIGRRELERYVSDYPVLDLAGAFEKDGVLKFSKEVHGDLSFLTGMPLDELIRMLREKGVL